MNMSTGNSQYTHMSIYPTLTFIYLVIPALFRYIRLWRVLYYFKNLHYLLNLINTNQMFVMYKKYRFIIHRYVCGL